MNDEQLMLKVTNGDVAALETLYDRYAPAVLGLARQMLGDQAAAAEVVQETFGRVWRNAESFSIKQGSFSAWLFGITRNLALDTKRQDKVRPQPLSSPAEDQAGESRPVPDVEVDETAWTMPKHTLVWAALSALPPEQRQVLELAYFRGMSRQEIAETTGLPLGAIHIQARLGLQRLQVSLNEQGFED